MSTTGSELRAAKATELRQTTGSAQEAYVLAVDLGTGGPKAAVVSATGRIAAHAFVGVGMHLTEDGGAEQSPETWWGAVVSAVRRVLGESGVRPEQVVGMGCTVEWSGTVPGDDTGAAVGPAIIWVVSRGEGAVREGV